MTGHYHRLLRVFVLYHIIVIFYGANPPIYSGALHHVQCYNSEYKTMKNRNDVDTVSEYAETRHMSNTV